MCGGLRAHARYALCRPYGTCVVRAPYPALTRWAIDCRRSAAWWCGANRLQLFFQLISTHLLVVDFHSLQRDRGKSQIAIELGTLGKNPHPTSHSTRRTGGHPALVVPAFHKHGDRACRNCERSAVAGEGCSFHYRIRALNLYGVNGQTTALVVGYAIADRVLGRVA